MPRMLMRSFSSKPPSLALAELTVTPGTRDSESATFLSGILPMSSAEMTSTTRDRASRLDSSDSSFEWRMPETMISSSLAPCARALDRSARTGRWRLPFRSRSIVFCSCPQVPLRLKSRAADPCRSCDSAALVLPGLATWPESPWQNHSDATIIPPATEWQACQNMPKPTEIACISVAYGPQRDMGKGLWYGIGI